MLTTIRLLEVAEAKGLGRPSLFVDLGCGRGVTCLTAASLGIPSLGLEQELAWVQAARTVADELGLPARFEAGDFLAADWPSEGLYFVVGTAYPDSMRDEIANRLGLLGIGKVITGDWSLEGYGYQRLWDGPLPVDWGVARFGVWRRVENTEI